MHCREVALVVRVDVISATTKIIEKGLCIARQNVDTIVKNVVGRNRIV